jgi:hypothetical protein
LGDLAAVGFETAIGVVETDAGEKGNEKVIKNSRQDDGVEGIVTIFFPANDEVIALVDFIKKLWNFGGIILKIGVKSENGFALGMIEASLKGGRFAEVAAEFDDFDVWIDGVDFFEIFKGFVGGTVVYENDFVGFVEFTKFGFYFFIRRDDRLFLIFGGDDER